VADPSWRPPPATAEQLAAAEAAIAAFAAWLKPAPADWLAARIGTLLQHFWVGDAPVEQMRVVILDFVSALAPYPRRAVEAACADLLGAPGRKRRKPLPADLVALCRDETRRDALTLELLRRFADPKLQAEAVARAEAARRPPPEPEDRAATAAAIRVKHGLPPSETKPARRDLPAVSAAELRRVQAETAGFRLAGEDDPAVKRLLAEMGAAP